jgi:hypothetical protein
MWELCVAPRPVACHLRIRGVISPRRGELGRGSARPSSTRLALRLERRQRNRLMNLLPFVMLQVYARHPRCHIRSIAYSVV